MAKRKSALPARETEELSPLLRSANALGRMIGALQRQIDHISSQLPIDLAHSAAEAKVRAAKRSAAAKGKKKKATTARKRAKG